MNKRICRCVLEHVKEKKLTRIALKREKLSFQCDNLIFDAAERNKDLEECRTENMVNNQLELVKLKVQMEAFTK